MDHPFSGTITLSVDATDTVHHVFRTHEIIPVQASGDVVLFYPRWEVASHSPTGPIWSMAGLKISGSGRRLRWRRDPLDPYAFHVTVPKDVSKLDLSLEYLSPDSGAVEIADNLITLTWSRTLLYPAGWYTRNIPVQASVTLPPGFQYASALDLDSSEGSVRRFLPVDLETLADTPLYGGRYTLHFDLAPGSAKPVSADLFADAQNDLSFDPGRLDRLRAGIAAVQHVFGLGHYRHYDMLISLSDKIPPDGGLEHQASSEVNLPANDFLDHGRRISDETLFTHEYVHSWNGISRQGEGMWTPDLNASKRDDSLWVYEGQTELWGIVLSARAGLMSRQEALDLLAVYAAVQQARVGRVWKTLSDTTNDPIYMIGHTISTRDWQRREDYYGGGVLLWLDVAMKLRQFSEGRVGLDDFAHRFFGGDDGSSVIQTYQTKDVAETLNGLVPFDWASLLAAHLETHDTDRLLDGISEGGYRLIYTRSPSLVFNQEAEGDLDLSYSLGLRVREDGRVSSVAWNSPASRAGILPGARIKTVDGRTFTPTGLAKATDQSGTTPVTLGICLDDVMRMVTLSYRGTLRYPHLQRIPDTPDRLGAMLKNTHP